MAHRDRSPLQLRAPSDRRVYVANIPFDMKWTELKDLFKHECGENSVSFVHYFDDADGKFRGCGIVEFKDSESAKRAVEKLHRHELNGRFLVVKEDYDVERDSTGRVVSRRERDRGDRDSGPRGRSPPRGRDRSRSPKDYGRLRGPEIVGGQGSGGPAFNTYGLSPKFLDSLGIDLPLTNKLFVSNLDYKVTKADLKRLFKICGRVLEVNLYMDKDGNSKGNATIELDHPIEAVQAISMLNRQVYQGRSLAIRMDRKENEELKLPPGLEGLGKGLGPGGIALRLPRNFATDCNGPPPVPPPTAVPAPAQVPAPAPVLPAAALAALGALAYPQDPVALAALASALDQRTAPQPVGVGNLFGGSNSLGAGLMGTGGPVNDMGRNSVGSIRNGSSRYSNDSGLGGSQKNKYADKDTRWGY